MLRIFMTDVDAVARIWGLLKQERLFKRGSGTCWKRPSTYRGRLRRHAGMQVRDSYHM